MDLVVTFKRMKRMKSSSSSSSDSEFFNNLSESLLLEILIRVPSKAVNRLKLVCKTWNSMISSKYFMECFNHRRHDQSLPPIPPDDSAHYSPGLVFQMFYNDVFNEPLMIHCDNRAHQVFDLSFLPPPQNKIEVRGCFGDLVLCSSEKRNEAQLGATYFYFYICNILTKQWSALPPLKLNRFYPHDSVGFLCVPARCSLCHRRREKERCGVDNFNYKFAVARFPLRHLDWPNTPNNISKFKVKLFSSENGRWRDHMVSTPKEIITKGGPHISVVARRGLLHLLVYCSILVYDPFNSPKRFSRVIDLPHNPEVIPWGVHNFGLQHGTDCLRMVLFRANSYVFIWELEDYEMGKWNLLHKLRSSGHFSQSLPAARLILCHTDGNAVFKLRNSSLWFCNLQSGTKYQIQPIAFGLGLVHYTAYTFVNQWWPTPVPPTPSYMKSCTITSNLLL